MRRGAGATVAKVYRKTREGRSRRAGPVYMRAGGVGEEESDGGGFHHRTRSLVREPGIARTSREIYSNSNSSTTSRAAVVGTAEAHRGRGKQRKRTSVSRRKCAADGSVGGRRKTPNPAAVRCVSFRGMTAVRTTLFRALRALNQSSRVLSGRARTRHYRHRQRALVTTERDGHRAAHRRLLRSGLPLFLYAICTIQTFH